MLRAGVGMLEVDKGGNGGYRGDRGGIQGYIRVSIRQITLVMKQADFEAELFG